MTSLPESGKERDIFLVALREFSDGCEAPQLTPECPFFEVTKTGPSCGEQCQDLLAEHGAPRSSSFIELGEGFKLYPRKKRRPRRGLTDDVRPFDATAIKLRDTDRPTSDRHTVSLLSTVENEISIPPHLSDDLESRNYLVGACLKELARRGFDEKLTRAGIVERLAFSMCIIYVGSPILLEMTDVSSYQPQEDWSRLGQEWLGHSRREDTVVQFVSLVKGEFFDAMQRWVSHLSIDEMLAWTAPSDLNELLRAENSFTTDESTRGLWLYQRFTSTYVDDWATSSLHLEWQYLHGSQVGCCPPDEMRSRKVLVNEVATGLATRATEKWSSTSSPDEATYRHNDFVRIAADYLAAGRHDAAISMYEALHKISPNDRQVTNNLGFCLLPRDPQRALCLFDQAWGLRGKKEAVTVANRMLALHVLGRNGEALSSLPRLSECECANSKSWLWVRQHDGSYHLESDAYPAEYANRLARHIEAEESCSLESGL